jgi:hypothetical protein
VDGIQEIGLENTGEKVDLFYWRPSNLRLFKLRLIVDGYRPCQPRTLATSGVNDADSLESCFQAIHLQPAGFRTSLLSWQIVCDLLESNCVPTLRETPEYLNFTTLLVEQQKAAYAQLLKTEHCMPLSFPKWRNQPFTMKEMEHALCEFSKYQRIERALQQGKRNTSTGQRLRNPEVSWMRRLPVACGRLVVDISSSTNALTTSSLRRL